MTGPSPHHRSRRTPHTCRAIVCAAGLGVALQAAVLTPTSGQAMTSGGADPPDEILGWTMSVDFPDLSQWPGAFVDPPDSCMMIALPASG
jgi:hypothetical protein